MGRHAQIVMGPAGCGKSTYCSALQQFCEENKRSIHVVNLDPAAENFDYPVAVDIRDLISVSEVMGELHLGPNGALVFCMEYLLDNMDWLEEKIGEFDDDYLVFDCPGQIELYSHIPVMKRVTQELQRWGYYLCGLYLVDSHFITDAGKFLSGAMMCLSAMIQLELPHINVLTKMDLVPSAVKKYQLERFCRVDTNTLIQEGSVNMNEKHTKLTTAIGQLIDDYSMVSFCPLDISNPDSIEELLLQIDMCTQYGEDTEPREEYPEAEDDDDEHDSDDPLSQAAKNALSNAFL
eukprot:GCRY01003497.1.p1 GENE.GCRY01003497.1~~GCRY01003497.1.p1  ORF type:complete len:292 (-),score=74.00 GCRY01003497.1:116-991(-)